MSVLFGLYISKLRIREIGGTSVRDQYGRTVDYIRVSITDRCNLRCRYCMPEGIELVSMEEILTYEEIERICTAAAKTGIRKLKITGGEPLVRLGCAELIGRLKQIPGMEQVTLTTNGVLLKEQLPDLKAAGLDAVNISLDSLDRESYRKITGRDQPPLVLESIESVLESGIVAKVNSVLLKSVNEKEWEDLAGLAERYPLDVRFIEMMPIGYGRQFEAVSNEEIRKKLELRYPEMAADEREHGNGPAQYYQIPGFQGSIGFISAIHGKFCGSCNRIRLTAQGLLKPCLCYGETYDLRSALRTEKKEEGEYLLQKQIQNAVAGKPEAHCFEAVQEITEDRKMVQIGG